MRCLFDGVVGNVEGCKVHMALHLMDDSISEGEGLPVFHLWDAMLAKHRVNLLMHVLCAEITK